MSSQINDCSFLYDIWVNFYIIAKFFHFDVSLNI